MQEIVRDIIHPALLERLDEIQMLAEEAINMVVDENRLPDDFADRRGNALSGLIKPFAGGSVCRVPYMSEIGCAALLRAQSEWEFSPNQSEGEAFQMDEFVLANEKPEYYQILKELHNVALVPLWVLVYGINPDPDKISSIQLARYKPGARAMTNWHYDRDSACTTVVELTSNAHETGAGLQVFPGIHIPVSEKAGYATMFQGKVLLHRSMPVTKGERVILVHWVEMMD